MKILFIGFIQTRSETNSRLQHCRDVTKKSLKTRESNGNRWLGKWLAGRPGKQTSHFYATLQEDGRLKKFSSLKLFLLRHNKSFKTYYGISLLRHPDSLGAPRPNTCRKKETEKGCLLVFITLSTITNLTQKHISACKYD